MNKYIAYDTDESGEALSPPPYLVAQEELTNEVLWSRVFASSSWTNFGVTLSKTEKGIDDTNNSASLISSTSGSYIKQTVTLSSINIVTGVWFIKKRNPERETLSIGLWTNGNVSTRYQIELSQETGVANVSFDSVPGRYKIIDSGDWWKVIIESSDTITGSDIDMCCFVGYDTGEGTNGDAIIDAFQLFKNKNIEEVRDAGPIFTTSTAVTTSLKPTFNELNHSNLAGPYSMKLDWAGDDVDVLTLGSDAFLKVEDDGIGGKQLTLTDQTNEVSLAMPEAPAEIEVGILYETDKMQLMLDDTYSAETTFTNSFGTGDLIVGENIRDLKRWSETTIEEQTPKLNPIQLTVDGEPVYNNGYPVYE